MHRLLCLLAAEHHALQNSSPPADGITSDLLAMNLPPTLFGPTPTTPTTASAQTTSGGGGIPTIHELRIDSQIPGRSIPLFAEFFKRSFADFAAASNSHSTATATATTTEQSVPFSYWLSDNGLQRLSAIVQTNLFTVSLRRPHVTLIPTASTGNNSNAGFTERKELRWTDSSSDASAFGSAGGVALYRRARNMNHACSGHQTVALTIGKASAQAQSGLKSAVNASTERVSFVAARDIKAGEELTWCYDAGNSYLSDTDTRRARLKQTYGFDCACPACR